jgi:hypothetical protein
MSENDTTDKRDTMSDFGLTLIDTRRAIPSQPTGDLGPNAELLVERLHEIGIQANANANLLTSVLVLSPRHAWVGGTPVGYLNIIDGRWDVWGEVDRADWFSFASSGGQVEIWFTGLPPGKLWLAVIEVSAYLGPS